MTYKIIILKRAQKGVRRVPFKDKQRIAYAIASLALNPFQGKQLQGEHSGAWAIRVWTYRIIYTIDRNTITVTVIKIGHRKDVYEKLR